MIYFTCCEQRFTGTEMIAHLSEVHGVVRPEGTERMMMCVDGRGFFRREYECKIGELIFKKTIEGRR